MHSMHLHTGHKAGCLQHCNAQLRAMPVCHAKHSAVSYACCKIQAQHSFSTCSDSENTACTACIYTQATKQGVSSTMHRTMPAGTAHKSRVSPALQCTTENYACLPCQAFYCLTCLLQDSGTAQLQHMQ